MSEYWFEAGRWDDALADLDALFEPGADVLDTTILGGHGVAALIAAHRDDRAGLAAHLHAAQELPDPAIRYAASYLLRARAVAAEQGGRLTDALALAKAAERAARDESPAEVDWLADLVRCALAAGDRAAAEAATARCEDQASGRGGPSVAMARWCRGLADSDPVLLAGAVAYYRTVTRPLRLGQAMEDLAVVHAAGGDPAAAKAALGEAVQAYDGLGAEWDIRRADTRVRPYGIRRRHPGARRPVTGWEALTPTEAKIAALVGEGLSNPDIGKRLFLSRNTVQSHMRKVLAKLQARSRVEVAMVAAARQRRSGPVPGDAGGDQQVAPSR